MILNGLAALTPSQRNVVLELQRAGKITLAQSALYQRMTSLPASVYALYNSMKGSPVPVKAPTPAQAALLKAQQLRLDQAAEQQRLSVMTPQQRLDEGRRRAGLPAGGAWYTGVFNTDYDLLNTGRKLYIAAEKKTRIGGTDRLPLYRVDWTAGEALLSKLYKPGMTAQQLNELFAAATRGTSFIKSAVMAPVEVTKAVALAPVKDVQKVTQKVAKVLPSRAQTLKAGRVVGAAVAAYYGGPVAAELLKQQAKAKLQQFAMEKLGPKLPAMPSPVAVAPAPPAPVAKPPMKPATKSLLLTAAAALPFILI